MNDIDLTRQLLVVRETKFAKSRFVPFGPRVSELIADYLSRRSITEHPMIADRPVFSFRKSQPLSPCTISTVFHELVSQLALPVPDGTRPPCVHSLRHYAASRTMPRVGVRAATHRHLNCVNAALFWNPVWHSGRAIIQLFTLSSRLNGFVRGL